MALVGLGNLGQALAGYPGFAGRGFVISALFDADPDRVGREVAGLPVLDIADAATVCRASGVTIGVIAVPASAAQEVADILVAAGVRSILNFAPGVLTVPAGVEVRHVDLSLELQILAFHESQRRRAEPSPEAVAADVMRDGRFMRISVGDHVRRSPDCSSTAPSTIGCRGLSAAATIWSASQGLPAGVPPCARSTS